MSCIVKTAYNMSNPKSSVFHFKKTLNIQTYIVFLLVNINFSTGHPFCTNLHCLYEVLSPAHKWQFNAFQRVNFTSQFSEFPCYEAI